MNRAKYMVGLATVALVAAAPLALDNGRIGGWSAAQAQPAPRVGVSAAISVDLFYNELQPQGEWVRNATYNYVWVPTRVTADWSPYTNGHWVYLERYGWYFESDEPFAWIVYHYGRWDRDDRLGWFWVPGTQWAPAWVTWRRDEQTVGWAPLPPEGRGIQIGFVFGREVPQQRWYFVRANQFLAPRLNIVISFGDRDADAWRRTRPVGPVVVQNNVVINNVIQVNFIQQSTGQKVEARRTEAVNDPNQARSGQAGAGGAIAVVTTPLAPPKADAKPAKVSEQAAVIEEKKKAPPGNTATGTPPAGASGAATGNAATGTPPAGAGGAATGNAATGTPPTGTGTATTNPPAGSQGNQRNNAATGTPPAGAGGNAATTPPAGAGGAAATTGNANTGPANANRNNNAATGSGTAGGNANVNQPACTPGQPNCPPAQNNAGQGNAATGAAGQGNQRGTTERPAGAATGAVTPNTGPTGGGAPPVNNARGNPNANPDGNTPPVNRGPNQGGGGNAGANAGAGASGNTPAGNAGANAGAGARTGTPPAADKKDDGKKECTDEMKAKKEC